MILAAWYHGILATLFGFLALILMGVILLQRGRGVGLAGAFGGAGGHTAFGSKTGDVLTWATIVIAGLLLLFAVLLNYIFVPLRMPVVTPPAPPPAAGAVTETLETPTTPSPTPAPSTQPGSAPASAPSGAWLFPHGERTLIAQNA